MASVASPGEVLVDTFASAPNINGQSFTAMGNISLSEGALLDVSADAAGTVLIRGGQLMMTNATISADTGDSSGAAVAVDINIEESISISSDASSAITARATGAGDSGEVSLQSENLTVQSSISDFATAIIDTSNFGTGNSGHVNLNMEAGNLIVDGGHFTGSFIESGPGGDGNGGNVTIKAGTAEFTNTEMSTGDGKLGGSGAGGHFAIHANSMSMNGVTFSTDSLNLRGGDLTFDAHNITFSGNSSIGVLSLLGEAVIDIHANHFVMDNSNLLNQTGLAPGGGIIVNAASVELMNNSQMASQTFGDGDAGKITVTATDHVTISDDPTIAFAAGGLFTNAFGDPDLGINGKAGAIEVITPILTMTGGTRINTSTESSGAGGDVTINAQQVSLSGQRNFEDGSSIFGLGGTKATGIYTRTEGIAPDTCIDPCGPAGNVSITTGLFNLAQGARVDSGTNNTGAGGTISVKATETISIAGTLDDGTTPGGVFSQTIGTEPGSGAGGAISLTSGQNFTISDGATVSANSSGPGNAGAINIDSTAGSVTIAQGAGVNSGTTGRGAGGTISLTADQNFTLSNGATVSASSSGLGNAGNITLGANNTILIDKATVTTEAREALGGNIKLIAGNRIDLTDSQVTSFVKQGSGNAGSINFDPDFIVIKNSIIKSTANTGNGGDINLTAHSAILIDPSSDLDASSLFGGSGRITIQSPIQNLSGTITPLPQNTLPVTALYGSRCVAGAGGNFSTFVDSKADSLAPRPGTFLASPFLPLSHGPQAGAGKAGRFSEVSGSGHAAPLQLASYVPPVLYAQADETNSACP